MTIIITLMVMLAALVLIPIGLLCVGFVLGALIFFMILPIVIASYLSAMCFLALCRRWQRKKDSETSRPFSQLSKTSLFVLVFGLFCFVGFIGLTFVNSMVSSQEMILPGTMEKKLDGIIKNVFQIKHFSQSDDTKRTIDSTVESNIQ